MSAPVDMAQPGRGNAQHYGKQVQSRQALPPTGPAGNAANGASSQAPQHAQRHAQTSTAGSAGPKDSLHGSSECAMPPPKLLVPQTRVVGFDAPGEDDVGGGGGVDVLGEAEGVGNSCGNLCSHDHASLAHEHANEIEPEMYRKLYIASDYQAIAARTKSKWNEAAERSSERDREPVSAPVPTAAVTNARDRQIESESGKKGERVVEYAIDILLLDGAGNPKTKHILWKRYSAFRALHSALCAKFGKLEVPQITGKTFATSKFSHTTMAKRQAKLNTFLQSVLKQPRLQRCDELFEFLGLAHKSDQTESRAGHLQHGVADSVR